MSEWIATTERLPEKPGKRSYEQVDCIIALKGQVIRSMWNCEHECWDDEDGDDFLCDPTDPTHWMLWPSLPVLPNHPPTNPKGVDQ